jgi:broad specificity phosphatase PhoE
MDDVKVNIYLLRHGEKNEDGSALSKNGVKQASYLAKKLKKIEFNKIYSSDLSRCMQTAEIVSKYHPADIIYDKSLREVEGKVKEFPEKHPKEIKTIKSFWNKVTKEKGNILVVASGNFNRILIALALKISPTNSRFVQTPTGLTHLEFMNNGNTRIEYVNNTSHLSIKLNKRQAY